MDGKKLIIFHPLFTFLTLLFVVYPEINTSTVELYCYGNNCGCNAYLSIMRNIFMRNTVVSKFCNFKNILRKIS